VIAGAPEHGAGLTVNAAEPLSVEPAALVKTARYSLPDSETLVGLIDNVVDVAPETLLQVTPLVESCHCTLGAAQFTGVDPAALNDAAAGAVTV
jgi:hypothetical protein